MVIIVVFPPLIIICAMPVPRVTRPAALMMYEKRFGILDDLGELIVQTEASLDDQVFEEGLRFSLNNLKDLQERVGAVIEKCEEQCADRFEIAK